MYNRQLVEYSNCSKPLLLASLGFALTCGGPISNPAINVKQNFEISQSESSKELSTKDLMLASSESLAEDWDNENDDYWASLL